MSAFLCDAPTLAAIARAAASLSEKIDAERVFSLLLDENLKSVGYRYPDATTIGDWFDEGEAAFIWENVPVQSHTATELLEFVACYEYQSCEHPEWETSTARELCRLLRAILEPRAKAEADAKAAKVAERQAALAKLPTLYGKETAVVIRKLLKAHFPACKFSVRSDFNSVRIGWTDGPTTKQVDALTAGLEASHFDGMTDSYNYDRDSVVMVDGKAFRPGCQYIFTNRDTSAAFARRCAEQIARYFGVAVPEIKDAGRSWTLGDNNARVEQAGEYWSTLIHQAACDRTRFARHD